MSGFDHDKKKKKYPNVRFRYGAFYTNRYYYYYYYQQKNSKSD